MIRLWTSELLLLIGLLLALVLFRQGGIGHQLALIALLPGALFGFRQWYPLLRSHR